jgi:hypothetical protein
MTKLPSCVALSHHQFCVDNRVYFSRSSASFTTKVTTSNVSNTSPPTHELQPFGNNYEIGLHRTNLGFFLLGAAHVEVSGIWGEFGFDLFAWWRSELRIWRRCGETKRDLSNMASKIASQIKMCRLANNTVIDLSEWRHTEPDGMRGCGEKCENEKDYLFALRHIVDDSLTHASAMLSRTGIARRCTSSAERKVHRAEGDGHAAGAASVGVAPGVARSHGRVRHHDSSPIVFLHRHNKNIYEHKLSKLRGEACCQAGNV